MQKKLIRRHFDLLKLKRREETSLLRDSEQRPSFTIIFKIGGIGAAVGATAGAGFAVASGISGDQILDVAALGSLFVFAIGYFTALVYWDSETYT